MASKLAIFVVLLAGLTYAVFEPVPKGYSLQSTVIINAYAAAGKAGQLVANVAEYLGIYSVVNLFKMATMPPPGGINFTQYDVEAVDEIFDGVKVRVYKPLNQKGPQPGFVYYHGGGWVLFSINAYDEPLAEMAKEINAIVVSVEYRLAPEHVFPAAHDDCVTATKFFLKNAKKYNVDVTRVAIGGDSAGGNLAATVALRLRDEKFEPKVKIQVLIYPVLQAIDLALPSYQNCDGLLLPKHLMAWFDAQYISNITHVAKFYANQHVPNSVRAQLYKSHLSLDRLPKKYTEGFVRPDVKNEDNELWKEIKSKVMNPYFSPLLADNLKGLPQTYIFSCEFDVLRDEALLYAYRLKEAGVPVEQYMFDKGYHGLILMGRNLPEIRSHFDNIYVYLKNNL